MNILLTGGAGYIGSHTAVSLLEQGHTVAILDNFTNSHPASLNGIAAIAGKKVKLFELDLLDQNALDKAFSQFKPQAVIHLAGLKAVAESVARPLLYYQANIQSTLNLLQAMAQYQCYSLIFSSSATVYGALDIVPIPESAPVLPVNPYGRTKLMIEQIIADQSTATPELKAVMLRYFNPVGAHPSGLIGENPNGTPNNLFPIVGKVAAGQMSSLKIFGHDYPTPDGTCIRDYIHVVDVAQGHLAALKYLNTATGSHIFNLGTGQGRSVLEIVNAYQNACGHPIAYTLEDRRPGDVAMSYSDPSLAKATLAWQANYSLDDMCRDAWNWQVKNPHGYASVAP